MNLFRYKHRAKGSINLVPLKWMFTKGDGIMKELHSVISAIVAQYAIVNVRPLTDEEHRLAVQGVMNWLPDALRDAIHESVTKAISKS